MTDQIERDGSPRTAGDPASSPVARRAHAVLPWRLIERITAYRQSIGIFFTLLVFVVALAVCWHMLEEVNPELLRGAIYSVPISAVLLSLVAASASYVMLLGYEWSAARYAGVRLPPAALVAGGACASAIGNAIGLSMLSGGAVRCRLYFRHGLGTVEVARMSVFVSLALGFALPPLAAAAALLDLNAASRALRLPTPMVVAIASGVFALYALVIAILWWQRLPERPTPDSRLFRLGRWSWRLPGVRLSLLQLVITLLDVIFAATVLYLLLPSSPPFSTFLLVYLLALAAGVLSHVPGGIGVFEAIILAAFASEVGAAPLTAALLLYRAIYVLLPLILACLTLLLSEGRRYLPARSTMRTASGLAAPVLSLMVFFSGVVLLFSGVTPEFGSRLETLGFFLPHRLIDASHFAASLIGVLCLLLARGLRRRLSAAWALTLALLVISSALSLLKGLAFAESAVTMGTALLLLVFRDAFYRRSRLLALPISARYLAASFCVVLASVWLMFFVYQDVPYRNELWWQFALDAEVPRALRAVLGSSLLLGVIALGWLMRPHPQALSMPSKGELEEALDIVKRSSQPEGGLVMSGDKALMFNDARSAFLMYGRRGRSMVALFDPIGEPLDRAGLIWTFRDLCDEHGSRPVFYQVRAENLPYYMDIGLTAVKLGEEALVDLDGFDLDAKQKKDLRYTWNRAQRDGLALEVFEAGEAPLDQLASISTAWLETRRVREKGFSLGCFDPEYLRHFRIAVIRHDGRIVAFANLLETERGETASIDLMRSLPEAPKLTMEFLMIGLILRCKAQGMRYFSLGMVPLAGLQPRRGAPMTQRLGAMIFRRGEQFYNFQGLKRFKDKFDPRWEPRYMAVPAGLDPLVALTDTAALIAGGFTGLVKR